MSDRFGTKDALREQLVDDLDASQFRPQPPRLLVPKKEAAYALGISTRAIDYLVASGRLKVIRIGNRTLVPAQELRRFARDDRPDRIRSDDPTQSRAAG